MEVRITPDSARKMADKIAARCGIDKPLALEGLAAALNLAPWDRLSGVLAKEKPLATAKPTVPATAKANEDIVLEEGPNDGDDGDGIYVIFSPSEASNSDGAGYWSNAFGWTDLSSATRFRNGEIRSMNLPLSAGDDARWHRIGDKVLVLFHDIDWTLDVPEGERAQAMLDRGLRSEMTLAVSRDEVDDLAENGADLLSDETGWAVEGFRFKVLEQEDTSGPDTDDVAEWVGLHYGRNFAAEPQAKQREWIERYALAHGENVRMACADEDLAEHEFSPMPDGSAFVCTHCGWIQESAAAGAAELCESATWTSLEGYARYAAIAREAGLKVPDQPLNFEPATDAAGSGKTANSDPWWCVVGRIPGDDEDTSLCFQAASREEAVREFEAAMYDGEVSPEQARANVVERFGEAIYVTSVLRSDSKIDLAQPR